METLDDMLETAHVDGVVVLVDKDADYAYAHTSYEKTRCRYAAVGKVRRIDDVVPTGIRLERGSGAMIRVQVGAIIGAVRETGAIALSQHIGRIFLNRKLRESMNLKSLMWVEIGAQTVEPSEASAQCFWVAKTVATVEDDGKLNSGIRKCYGRFSEFLEKNVCLLELFGRNAGFVCLRPSDFHLPVPLKKLREAKAIQVYANLAVSTQKKFPVPGCCARVLEEDELKTLPVDETDAAPEDITITAVDKRNTELNTTAVAETIAAVQDKLENKLKCNHAELLRQLMRMEHVATELQKRNLDLYQRVTNSLDDTRTTA
uniref:SPOC domain-containing protein n=1 Tax=Ascaris lumbricoides TaxID=6252 RepID=A0A0M3I7T2_ASCLU